MLFGKKYHKELYGHIRMITENESISQKDMDLLFLTDSVEEMKAHLKEYAVKRFGLITRPMEKRWWFGETMPKET
ncbi:MAG: hypothetical protein ACJAWH_002017 [Maribacter sp.]